MNSALFKSLLSFSFCLVLSACGSSGGPVEPPPIIIDLSITASDKVNPDIENRASPIVIRVYQLTHIDIFNNSDFFALYENDKTLLAKELKFREELEVKPSQSISKPFEIKPETKYIAVLAAFRDLDKAQWKSILQIEPQSAKPLEIELGQFTVNLKTKVIEPASGT